MTKAQRCVCVIAGSVFVFALVFALTGLDRGLSALCIGKVSGVVGEGAMGFVTGLGSYPWFLLGLLLWLIWRHRVHFWKVLLPMVFIVITADFVSARILKPLIGRDRPRPAAGVHPSFPSNHATNWFAAVRALASHEPRATAVLYPLACVVGYSRVDLGAHYPADVVGGAAFGHLWAMLMIWFGSHFRRRLLLRFRRVGIFLLGCPSDNSS